MTVPSDRIPADRVVAEPLWKADAWGIYSDAMADHHPRRVFALFSGGHDSSVLVHWARRQLGDRLDAAVFIDTGTALPGVRRFVENFTEDYCNSLPLLVYEAGNAFERMVLSHGFPGPASHRFAYIRLKERQVRQLVRDHKTGRADRIMLLTGVRRAESQRRMGSVQPVMRDGATVWVAPLIDWTDADMRAYRAEYGLPESDVAALLHMSGECGCGAFAAPGERAMRASLFPEWDRWLVGLEARAEAAGIANSRWGERPTEVATAAGPMCSTCQLRFASVGG